MTSREFAEGRSHLIRSHISSWTPTRSRSLAQCQVSWWGLHMQLIRRSTARRSRSMTQFQMGRMSIPCEFAEGFSHLIRSHMSSWTPTRSRSLAQCEVSLRGLHMQLIRRSTARRSRSMTQMGRMSTDSRSLKSVSLP